MTVELQSQSTQLYYMLLMMLSDQALEIVRNSPESNGAEVWRKLLLEYELGVGIRYGSMVQYDLVNTMRQTWHGRSSPSISKYEQQSSDLISDAIKHGIVCGRRGTPRFETARRSEYQSTGTAELPEQQGSGESDPETLDELEEVCRLQLVSGQNPEADRSTSDRHTCPANSGPSGGEAAQNLQDTMQRKHPSVWTTGAK